MLRVRIHGAELRARDAGLAAPVDGVRTATAAPDDLDRDVDRLDDRLDLLVVAVLRFFLRLRGPGRFALFLCLGFLVSCQSFAENRVHWAMPFRSRPAAGGNLAGICESSHTAALNTRLCHPTQDCH